MDKKGKNDLEDIFRAIAGVIFLAIFISALAPILGTESFLGLSSFMIGLTIIMIIIVFFIRILEEFKIIK